MRKDEKRTEKLYDSMALLYHKMRTSGQGSFYNEFLEMPATLSLLGDVKGKKILDFGCGTGIYAKKLSNMGAKVYGFDVSNEMLKIAKNYAPKAKLKKGSGYNIPFDGKFDVVVAALVLDYFKDWNKVFKNVHKKLKKNGIFVFSTGNPVAESRKKIKYKGKTFMVLSDYFVEGEDSGIWRFEKKYFKPEDWKFKSSRYNLKVTYYHKTYETVINTILKNGFEIVGYKDAFPLKKSKKLFPNDYKKFSQIPFFCSFKLKKK
jgi:2-polyprenyl-3-methyl-5-hydroxy-6-metoxy-1,4-benzoquinol methylase